jgi:hypothetical protein
MRTHFLFENLKQKDHFIYSSTLKMKAAGSSETLIPVHEATRHRFAEHRNFNGDRLRDGATRGELVHFHSVEICSTAKHAEECEFLAVECESIFRPPFADVSELAALPPLLLLDAYLEPTRSAGVCVLL